MKNYFDNNYELLESKDKNNSYLKSEECEEIKIIIDRDLKENEIFAIEKNDRIWYLGSRYDNDYYIEKWVDSIELSGINAIVCIFGLGDFRTVEQLTKKYPENKIIVYEPNLSYLKSIMEAYDMSALFGRDNFNIFAGEKGFVLFRALVVRELDITNYKTSVFKINTQYGTLYDAELTKWNNGIQDRVTELLVDKNTYRRFGEERLHNNLANFYDCIKSRNVKEVAEVVMKENCETAILVAAGPSLDKNVHLLKKAKNKAFIMVVDTAIKPVLKAGVMPDLTVSIDSHKPKELFIYNDEFVDIPMLVDLQSNEEVISQYRGRRFYIYNFSKTFFRIYNKDDYMLISLDSGGSVANDAFSFLAKCGFKNIIFIGQDLAYSNDKTHTGDAYNDERKIKYEKKDDHILVEDIYGNQVYTEENMNVYRKWFERYMANYENIRFIDATEGGAKINGTEIMTLEEAIEQVIENLPYTDYENIIRNMPDISEEEFTARMDRLCEIPDELAETKSDIKIAFRLYDELDELNRKNKQTSARFKKVADDISEITKKIENSIYASFASNIIDDTEYDILEEIYDDRASVYEEVKLVIESGRKMLDKYSDNFEMLQEKINKMVADTGWKK